MRKTVVINAVGLTQRLIGDATPRLTAFMKSGAVAAINAVIPAVTCSVQSTYLTGTWPSEHGIVGNGWYFRDECEVKFWRQSNQLVQRPKVWDIAKQRDPAFTCANLFWWYNMYSSADFSVTPRPMYPADGRKLPDVYAHPPELRESLQRQFGQFPLFKFWGPATSIEATRWIADAAMAVDVKHDPTLSLIYLPHLDYGLQRHGPDSANSVDGLRELDAVCGRLIDFYGDRARIIILSEYGIAPVTKPVHLNRLLHVQNLLAVREEMGGELLDAGASDAFAVADHQIAHIYVSDPSKIETVKALIESVPGVARVLDAAGKRAMHLDHPRSGELIAMAEPGAWFTYYYWLDEARRPDFATTVDIHRKPGYDPAELFIDPKLSLPKLKIATTLLKKKLGFRTLLNVIPTDASLVKGSHGLAPSDPLDGATLLSTEPGLIPREAIDPTDVMHMILHHIFD